MAHPWELGDHEQRWKGYMHPVYDLTLRTKLGAMPTPEALRAAEDEFVEARSVTLATEGLPGSYDLRGLRAAHRHLFQDVYEWAGDLRTVSMAKGGQAFAHFEDIPVFVGEVAGVVRDTDMLRAAPEEQFPESLAMVYHGLNAAHPFREGNGRTQRVFVTALAQESGHRLDWTKTNGATNDLASRRAHEGDMTPLVTMFREVTATRPESRKTSTIGAAHELHAAAFPGRARSETSGPTRSVRGQSHCGRESPGQGPELGG